jgi:membrane protease subunit HflK
MQKVLSNSSKIIVDGKSGNLLYLPLDKMMSEQNNALSRSLKKNENNNSSTDENNYSMVGRDLTRPTYSQGGS